MPGEEHRELFDWDEGEDPPKSAKTPAASSGQTGGDEPASDPASESINRSIPGDPSTATGLTERRFLPWSKPLAESAAAVLAEDWDRTDVLDLSEVLVVTQTQQSSRRFREALATLADQSGSAVVPPLVVTPSFFVGPERLDPTPTVAEPSEEILAWESVLAGVKLDDFREIFPVDPLDRAFDWALRTADEFRRVRTLLGESGLDFAKTAERMKELGHEPLRWEQLATLESRYRRELENRDLADREHVRSRACRNGVLPPEAKRIVLVATADPIPLAVEAMARHAAGRPVEVLVWAPPEMAGQFDDWGRPLGAPWRAAEIDIPSPKHRIHVASQTRDQARTAVDLATFHQTPSEFVAFGLPDPLVGPDLLDRLDEADLRGYDPGGDSLSSHLLHDTLRSLHLVLATGTFAALANLARHPGVHHAIASGEGDLTPNGLLRGIDNFGSQHLPDSLEVASELAGASEKNGAAKALLGWWARWRIRFEKEQPAESVLAFLTEIFGDREIDLGDDDGRQFSEVATKVTETIGHVSDAQKGFPHSRSQGAVGLLRLVLLALGEERLRGERPRDSLDLHGWLELIWEPAPHLVVTGFNEGKVPTSVQGDAYLPDSVRAELGIRSNDDRLARDSYLLTALLQSRELCGGKVDLVFGRTGGRDEPLRPSGLLFRCPDDQLAARVLDLFKELPPPPNPPGRDLGDPFPVPALPEEHKLRERISVTKFRDFLACPFRFYLRHGRGMERRREGAAEMDPLQLGTILHAVVESYGKNPEQTVTQDPEKIAGFFAETLDDELTKAFGKGLTLPLEVQRASLMHRLEWVAQIEAQSRADGWTVHPDDVEMDLKLPIEGVPGFHISGKIDRIERHPEKGIRVLDFKTGVRDIDWKKNYVEGKHLRRMRTDEIIPETQLWRTAQDGRVWTDLQVPLYVLALRNQGEAGPMAGGYFGVGRKEGEVVIELWENLESLLPSAEACARGVVAAVHGGTFWPPADKVTWDEMEDFTSHGHLDEWFDGSALVGATPVEGGSSS